MKRHSFERRGLGLSPKGLDVVTQISYLCLFLHHIWEYETGVEISATLNTYKSSKERDTHQSCMSHARLVRERSTLLYQVIASHRLATRRSAALSMATEFLTNRSATRLLREEEVLSVTFLYWDN